jgi:hypothetical protein
LLAAAVWGAALAALVSWWRYPENALNTRFDAFDIQGFVPVAYALFAVALGIGVGSVIRRVLPSLAVTLAIFVGVRVAFGIYLRPHYLAPLTKLFPPLEAGPPPGAWVLSTALVGPAGASLAPGIHYAPGHSSGLCSTAELAGPKFFGQCLSRHGFHQLVTYQPDSRFWTFQGVEAGIFVLLAAALVAFAAWRVLTRDA